MILFLTNADTELLALRTVAEGLPAGFPPVRGAHPGRLGGPVELEGVQVVLVRLLGGRRAFEGLEALAADCRARDIPLLAFGGEVALDPELVEVSSVPGSTVVQAFEYLAQGGLDNIEQLLRFVADTILDHAFGFEPPRVLPECGWFIEGQRRPDRPTVGVVFYRAHVLALNTRFVEDLCGAIEAKGANAAALYCYSLRPPPRGGAPPAVELLGARGVDAVVTTVLAAGGSAEGGDGWDPGALAALDVPVVQAVCATSSSASWAESDRGLSPLDVAMAVALPEFDGRIIGPAFSFKEQVDDGADLGVELSAYRTVSDRLEAVAALAVAHARLRRVPVEERKVALVLSAYPTKRSRLGNAVGLDTPASVLALLRTLAELGYRVTRIPESGDELMAELADGLTYDRPSLGPEERARALAVWPAACYEEAVFTFNPAARQGLEEAWGEAPGTVRTDDEGSLVLSGLDLGHVVVAVQPPRGFGDNPVAVYHSPDLAPTHHYVAFYRWLAKGFGAHAIVHVGKHGTLEWLPGKSVGLSAACFPDVALGHLPLVYPFVVNDPGEGTQAKRRAHAVIVDHLVPPLTRADTYDDLARLESLLDTHAQVAALDPSKLPAVRRQVYDVMVEAEIHRDLGLGSRRPVPSFEDEAFDDLLLEVDGYLCELKDAQIRGGLHVLGQAPQGEAEIDLVAAITRLPQGGVPALRAEVAADLGVDLEGASRVELDAVEAEGRCRLARCQALGWDPDRLAEAGLDGSKALRFACERLVPALSATSHELDAVARALDGRFVEPGPSGAPSRGMAHVLPTGRNFYAVDPKAVPSPLAYEVGCRLAEELVARHVAETGGPPAQVALVVWGTSAMRTGGDDIAEALALLGVRPVWEHESGRVTGIELVSTSTLGRPRVDVTLRISGFFRDAFPHVLDLFDQAVALAAAAHDEEANPVAWAGAAEPRVFGPMPGAYGSGIFDVLTSGAWEDREELAATYLARSAFAYGAGGEGRPAPEALRRRLERVEVAVKNQDNREHDIFDADDYLQDHGGLVAAIASLAGRAPVALFGDSADPARPRVRTLEEEAARVVRSRVLNPKWLAAMRRHGYKGAFEMAATVDYLYGYDATASVVEDWMYERVTQAYVGDPQMRAFFAASNPWALRAICERLLEADRRGLWAASEEARQTLAEALLFAEGLEEER